jgi:hypothetical protein
MSGPKIRNRTPFEFAPVFVPDVNGQQQFAPLLKASFSIDDDGRLTPLEKQPPVLAGGQWWGDPESTSLKYEPEATLVKPATDVVLIGHAYPARPNDAETIVGLRVGPIRKLVQVFGARCWVKRASTIVMSRPRPFEKIPLRWEYAFGGWDRSAPEAGKHRCEPRNPVGSGFRVAWNDEPYVALPHLEHPNHRIKSFTDRPPPVGFGFVSPHWQPRVALAGTYDAAWSKTRRPLLPLDFDRRFLNAAPVDQIVPGYLLGNEEVSVLNASSRGSLKFVLPGDGRPPLIDVTLHGGRTQSLMPVLDTLIIDTDDYVVSLLWRAAVPVADVPASVISAVIEWEGAWPGMVHRHRLATH